MISIQQLSWHNNTGRISMRKYSSWFLHHFFFFFGYQQNSAWTVILSIETLCGELDQTEENIRKFNLKISVTEKLIKKSVKKLIKKENDQADQWRSWSSRSVNKSIKKLIKQIETLIKHIRQEIEKEIDRADRKLIKQISERRLMNFLRGWEIQIDQSQNQNAKCEEWNHNRKS